MQKHAITGTLRFMGEPAEKVRGSKPIHAAKGYYDGLDAIISFHPFYMLPLCNTARWDTHCGPYYAAIYEFLCERPETWLLGAVTLLIAMGAFLSFAASPGAAGRRSSPFARAARRLSRRRCASRWDRCPRSIGRFRSITSPIA